MVEKKTPSPTLSWEKVENYVNEKSKGGAAMAVIETEKIFDEVLKKRNFPGKTTDQRVRAAQQIFSDYTALKLARDVYKKLALEINAEIQISDLKEILSSYHQAIRDLTKTDAGQKKFTDKAIMLIRHYINAPRRLIKRVALSIVAVFFLIFLLDSTSVGRSIVSALVKTAHFIFSWVLFTLLLVVGIIIIVVGGVLYFESRKKRTKPKIENK